MNIVVIESPYAGDVDRNLRYVRAAMRDCLHRGESPYASHALLTQEGVLDDDIPAERKAGMKAGFQFHHVADVVAVYEDLGISGGMKAGIAHAKKLGADVEYRRIDWDWE